MKLFLFILVCMLVVLHSATALDTTSDPTPTVQIAFDQADIPVTIRSAKLYYNSGDNLNLSVVKQTDSTYNIPINYYLLQGDYKIIINATDVDGNDKVIQEPFTVTSQDRLKIIEPKVLSIRNQDFAIGNSTSFTLKMESVTPSVCRIKKYRPPIINVTEEFLQPGSAMYFNNNPNSLSTSHRIDVEQGSGFKNNKLLLQRPFDYDALSRGEYVAICRQTGIGGRQDYFAEPFYVGYDVSKPQPQVFFQPSKISDPSSVETTMIINTTEDRVVCSYNHTVNPNNYQGKPQGTLPLQAESLLNYSTHHNVTLRFPGVFFQDPETTFTVDVMCENPAQEVGYTTGTYSVDLASTVNINILQTQFATANPTINFTTSVNTACDVRFEDDTLTTPFDTRHSYSPRSLSDGTYDLELYCQGSRGNFVQKEQTITIDTTPPNLPQISSEQNTCGTGLAQLNIQNSSEKLQYNITLSIDGSIVKSELYPSSSTDDSVDYSQPLPDNATGQIRYAVIAIDNGGLRSRASSVSTKIIEFDPVLCDTTPPKATVSVEKLEDFAINLTCTDEQSNCRARYDYDIVSNATCPNVLTQSHPINTTLLVESGGRFCYQVSNNAGLNTSGSRQLRKELFINVTNPSMGIASSSPFSLVATTNRKATCRHGPRGSGNLDADYQTLDDFSESDTLSHVASVITDVYENISDDGPTPWSIICEEKGNYYEKKFTLTFDTTPPIIDITFSANPVINPETSSTDIVVTTDDETICTYLDSNGVSKGFRNYNPEIQSSYRSRHTATIDLFGLEDQTINQIVACRNKAQLIASTSGELEIKRKNSLSIMVTSPKYYNTRNPTLSWTTNEDVLCSYRIEPNQEFRQASSQAKSIHEQQLSGIQGEQSIEIVCGDGTKKSYATYTFFVDTLEPRLELYTQNPSCTEGTIIFVAATDGSGSPVSTRRALLYQGQTVISNETFNTIQHQMPANNITELQVIVTDKAGNTAQRTVSIQPSLRCDTTSPTTSLQVTPVWKGYNFDVTCNDDQSCAPTYLYTTNSCIKNTTTLQEYTPFTQKETAEICYWSYDTAGNLASEKTERVEILRQCFNEIEDPDEEGVDCGGPCLAECGLCSNNIKDPFEEGVDCGGICQTSCTQPSRNTVQTECSVDMDCNGDEICNFSGECVQPPEAPNPTPEETSFPWLAAGLILIGLGSISAGSYYIYISQQGKKVIQQQPQQNQPSAAQIEAEAKARQRRMQELQEQHKKQDETRKSHVQERKKERENLLSKFQSFETPKTETSQIKDPTEDNSKKTVNEAEKNNYVHINSLHESKEPEGIFSDLASLNNQELKIPSLDELEKSLSGKSVNEIQEQINEQLQKELVSLPTVRNALDGLMKSGDLSRDEVHTIMKGLQK